MPATASLSSEVIPHETCCVAATGRSDTANAATAAAVANATTVLTGAYNHNASLERARNWLRGFKGGSRFAPV